MPDLLKQVLKKFERTRNLIKAFNQKRKKKMAIRKNG